MQRRSDPALGDTLAGKYRVERVIGQGGMAMVVAASHLVLGHQVAVKYLLPDGELDDEAIARFLREAQVTARLKSVHVAKTLDMGQLDDGRPFLVMELLEGHDLGEELVRRPDVPIHEVAGWILQACEGVAEAHAAGIIHRDLKPSNLFLARQPSGPPVVKVLDFGISKLVAAEAPALTSTEAAFGSPAYMSPEQLQSSKGADVRSDVWAMGVILYEALSGVPPFTGATVFALANRIMEETPVPLSTRRKEVPAALSAIVMRCLAKSAGARPQSISELAAALAPFAGDDAKERASRIRGLTTERLPAAAADADASERWTSATTERDLTRRRGVFRPAVVAAFALVATATAAIVWRSSTPPSTMPEATPSSSLAVGPTPSLAVGPPPSEVVSTTVESPVAPPVADAAAVAAPSVPKKKRPPAPSVRPAPSASPPPVEGPIIDVRTN